MRWILGPALVVLALVPAALPAQSLFSTRGLGLPLDPLDARSQLLGGSGVGLIGLSTSLVNPAEVAGIRRRGVSAGLLTARRTMEFEGEEGDAGTTRFPLVRVVLPLSERLVVSLGYGSFLDQTWGVTTERRAFLGGDTLDIEDVIESDGGLSQFRVGLAFTVADGLALGVAGGAYTGRQDIIFTRRFGEEAPPGFQDFNTRVAWSYSAPLASVGMRWDPSEILRFGGALTWSGTLDADGDRGEVADQSFDLPLEAVVGASAILSPGLIAAVSGRWSGWSVAADGLAALNSADDDAASTARDVWGVGAGIEYDGADEGSTEFPLRLGFHYRRLPFTFEGGAPSEWSAGAGIGLRVGVDRQNPLAVVDLAVHHGRRGDVETTVLAERFWRAAISLTLFGP